MIQPYIRTLDKFNEFAKHRREQMRLLGEKDLKNNPATVIIYMDDIYNRDHIHTFTIDPRNDPIQIQQTIPSNKEVEIIHSGFSAGKLENQNEFTNCANNISISPIEIGVTL